MEEIPCSTRGKEKSKKNSLCVLLCGQNCFCLQGEEEGGKNVQVHKRGKKGEKACKKEKEEEGWVSEDPFLLCSVR